MNTELMFSSKTDLWSTPQDFFNKLDDEFHFTLDVCATAENAKCAGYFTEGMLQDSEGLPMYWHSEPVRTIWMNPPYGRTIGLWVRKAWQTSQLGDTVVCLLPARTDTKWWHDYCMRGEIRFIKGRLKFGGQKNSAPFPSAVVIFRPKV